ncbi:MAG: DNA internalization-related competence protein ComEC/Rec2 [Burkholderiales bacterium PBB3]|nr:MAG: DNA internalization-related competence protein ComEC/Rec2 [Burkholderiales bacterium PBB3]
MLGWVVGSAWQLQQVALWPLGVYVAFMPLGLMLSAGAAPKKIVNAFPLAWRSGWRLQACSLLGAALLAFAATGLRATVFLADALDPALEGRDVVVTGVVANLPQRNEAALRFRLQVEAAALNGAPVRVPPRMDVGWYGGAFPAGPAVALGADLTTPPAPVAALNRLPPNLVAGERLQLTLRLKAPHGARNPHGFDYELWLWDQGVQATGYVRAGPKDLPPSRLGTTWSYPVSQLRQAVRDAVLARIENRQQAGLIAALVVGDQAAVDRADWDVFRATGVAHLVSISGLHITMLAWGAALGAGWLWRRSSHLCRALPAPTAALLGGVAVALAYSAFAGWGVPAQRTCIMLATVAALRLTGARWPWPQVWMLACAVVVAWDPWALLQSGFWLSFVAVGVLFATDLGAAPALSTASNANLASNSRAVAVVQRLGMGLKHLLREQWVITVALAPLTLLLFGQVSVVGLLANLVAVPWVTLVVTPLALLGCVIPPLWDVAAQAISALLWLLQGLAGWPWASLQVAVAPLGVAVLGAVGALLLVAPLPPALRVLGLPLLLPVLLWQAPSPAPGEFELLAADVGQGNAVLVRTAGHALLFDAGPRFSLESDAGHRVLVPLMQALQTRLDLVVLSHRDLDHVGGAPAVLAMQPQAELLSSIEADNPLQNLRTAKRCVAGQHWVWDGVEFAVLHPQASDYDTPAKPNALSCVLRISNGRQTALLTGDIEQPQEARLGAWAAERSAQVKGGARRPGDTQQDALMPRLLVQSEGTSSLHSDVLLVPHHGSNTSSSGAFLDAVTPRIAIVQSGYRNRFGHPTALVMERYTQRGIAVVDSPHCGAYTWQSWVPDAPASGACWRLSSQRYWHHRVP